MQQVLKIVMAYDEYLAQQVRQYTAGNPGITEKRMFGGLCFMLNGNMLVGISDDRYMLRVGKEKTAELLQLPGVSPMDFTGKPLAGFVYVDETVCQGGDLADWIDIAMNFVKTLPVKKPK